MLGFCRTLCLLGCDVGDLPTSTHWHSLRRSPRYPRTTTSQPQALAVRGLMEHLLARVDYRPDCVWLTRPRAAKLAPPRSPVCRARSTSLSPPARPLSARARPGQRRRRRCHRGMQPRRRRSSSLTARLNATSNRPRTSAAMDVRQPDLGPATGAAGALKSCWPRSTPSPTTSSRARRPTTSPSTSDHSKPSVKHCHRYPTPSRSPQRWARTPSPRSTCATHRRAATSRHSPASQPLSSHGAQSKLTRTPPRCSASLGWRRLGQRHPGRRRPLFPGSHPCHLRCHPGTSTRPRAQRRSRHRQPRQVLQAGATRCHLLRDTRRDQPRRMPGTASPRRPPLSAIANGAAKVADGPRPALNSSSSACKFSAAHLRPRPDLRPSGPGAWLPRPRISKTTPPRWPRPWQPTTPWASSSPRSDASFHDATKPIATGDGSLLTRISQPTEPTRPAATRRPPSSPTETPSAPVLCAAGSTVPSTPKPD